MTTLSEALLDQLDQIGDGDMYDITRQLSDDLVDQDMTIAVYTTRYKRRPDGTRELKLTFGWNVNGEDQEELPNEDERLIIAHRLVMAAVSVLKNRWTYRFDESS